MDVVREYHAKTGHWGIRRTKHLLWQRHWWAGMNDDIRAVVKSLGGADVVYDPVGGDQFRAAFRACRPEARIITLGFASGDVPQIPANHMMVKNISVEGLNWGAYARFAPQVMADSITTLLGWYAEGRLRPHIGHSLPLDQADEALALLRERRATGKIVVTMG